jgi:hypothetical protein
MLEGIWTTDDLVDSLSKTPILLAGLLVGVDEALVHARPAPGEWSTVEVIGHLTDSEERAVARISMIQQEDDPVFIAYDQDALVREHGYQDWSLQAVLDRFLGLRSERLALLTALTGEQWLRTAVPPGGSSTPLAVITAHLCWHDTNHLAQIANNLSAARG